jgi:hypothetical protein
VPNVKVTVRLKDEIAAAAAYALLRSVRQQR